MKAKTKKCIGCGEMKSLGSFIRNKEYGIFSPHCRRCVKNIINCTDKIIKNMEKP